MPLEKDTIIIDDTGNCQNTKIFGKYIVDNNKAEALGVKKVVFLKDFLSSLDSYSNNLFSFKKFRRKLSILYLILRAKYIIHDYSPPLYNKKYRYLWKFLIKRTLNICLWHGMPIKNILYHRKVEHKNLYKFYFVPKSRGNLYFFVTSDYYKLIFSSCFLLEKDKIFVTGQPRNDVLLDKKDNLPSSLKKRFTNFSKVILLCLTHSDIDMDGSRSDFYKNFCKTLENIGQKHNVFFIIKPHPGDSNYSKNIDKSDSLFVMDNDFMSEYQILFTHILKYTDMLITDYSSAYIDYLLLDKPIVFFDSLKQSYEDNRGFLMGKQYKHFLPGPIVNDAKKLENAIIDEIKNDNYKEKRKEINDLFNEYKDNKSCERVFNIIKNLCVG